MAKVATVITNQFEDSEFLKPKEAYEEAGHEVITIEKEAGNEVTGSKGSKVKIDVGIEQANIDEFDALLIPGGFSPD